jgi:carbamoyltransferase
MFYATYTQLLGYRPDSDEWKVMAMSGYQGDCSQHLEKIRTTYMLHDDGTLELDLKYYVGSFSHYPNLFSPELIELLGPRGSVNKDAPSDWDMSVAKAMQLCSEEIARHFLHHLYERTKSKKVALGGGFFMNSVFNGKVLESSPFEQVYLSYAPSDAGNSIGAALYVNHLVHDEPRVAAANSSLIGPSFNDDVVQSALHRRRIPFTKIDNIPETTAKLCADGHVVAFFNGRMEFGDRALGARSILADPRREEMKDKINAQVKYREAYRPFAPATVGERVHLYFDVPEGFQARYMEQVVKVRPEYAAELPAVTHFDRSARVQTVMRDESALFHAVLEAFEALTGFPVLVNTSFNVNGEPIVLTPDDAITTFFNSGLEYLVIGNCLVSKEGVGAPALT